ncbi:hypothetical protein [Microbacterium sp.]|uniref:hypothetical protein n=1 Tax=Microbacterium sp. TaxID=51671 RepID=UPI003242CB7E
MISADEARELLLEIVGSDSDEAAANVLAQRVSKVPVVSAIGLLSRTLGQTIPYLRAMVRIDEGDIQLAMPGAESDAGAMALAFSVLNGDETWRGILDVPSQFHRLQLAIGAVDCLASFLRGLEAQPATTHIVEKLRDQLRFGIDTSAEIHALDTDSTPQ